MVRISSSYLELSVNNTSNTSHFHQSGYSRPGHLNTSFVKFASDFWTSISAVAFFMNLSDQLKDTLPICLSGRWLSIEPTVVATSAHLERFTHPRGVRFSTAKVDRYFFINLNICCRSWRRCLPGAGRCLF